jgi:uncharacterized membrane protein YoaK (UPF0700 family)
MLLALTFVTGLVDAASYLLLGHVFVANMTGNVLFLGFALAGTGGFSLPSVLLALAAFSVGAAVGGRVTVASNHRGVALFVVAAMETALLAAAAAIGVAVQTPVGGWVLYGLIGLMAVAMGARNAVVRWLAVPDMTTTVLTMTLTGIAADAGTGGGATSRMRPRLLAVLAMLAGGLVGALFVLHWTTKALLLPLVVLLAVCVAAGMASRSRAGWVRAR